MTTERLQAVTCGICGRTTCVSVIMSTNRFGSADLDTRPPKMERWTIYTRVQRCQSCGYCAGNIALAFPDAQAVIQSPAYQNQLNDLDYPRLAASFLCKSILEQAAGHAFSAAWSLIHAAWVCDDENKHEQAAICRLKAVEMLTRVENEGTLDPEARDSHIAVRVDLLRRANQLSQARQLILDSKDRLAGRDVLPRIMEFQLELIANNDLSCHTVAEAFKAS